MRSLPGEDFASLLFAAQLTARARRVCISLWRDVISIEPDVEVEFERTGRECWLRECYEEQSRKHDSGQHSINHDDGTCVLISLNNTA